MYFETYIVHVVFGMRVLGWNCISNHNACSAHVRVKTERYSIHVYHISQSVRLSILPCIKMQRKRLNAATIPTCKTLQLLCACTREVCIWTPSVYKYRYVLSINVENEIKNHMHCFARQCFEDIQFEKSTASRFKNKIVYKKKHPLLADLKIK